MRKTDAHALTALGVAVALALIPLLSIALKKDKAPLYVDDIAAIIDLGHYADTSKALLTGYNYYLLEKYAATHGIDISISLAGKEGSGLDSLRAGTADIVVEPFIDTLKRDSVLTSIPVDSMSVWLMSHQGRINDVNRWLDLYHNSEGFESTRSKFLHTYSPSRSRRRPCLSPYDSLIRAHADSIGWDWKMLAAIIYQESRFHIEVTSRRGAAGLMQMMPETAKRFGVVDALDPDSNIGAGAAYLKFLEKKFRNYGDNRTEHYKYILAAYNAGEGRILDCIKYAGLKGADVSYWQNIVNLIPEMSDPEAEFIDSLRFGTFKGQETIRYVESVIDIYNNFCRICPDQAPIQP